MNSRSFLIALLLSVLSFASTVRADRFNASNPFAVENAFDLNYDVINPWSENRLPGEFVRNYNRDLAKLYDNLDKSGPFKYCATGGFGCNYMSQSSFKGALKGHEARAQESIASYRRVLENKLVDYRTDITNIQNGRDIEGPLTKALLRGRKVSPNSQLQIQKGEIVDENRHLSNVLMNRQDLSSDAQAILDSGVLTPEIPDPNAIEEADNSIDDPTRAIDRWGYSSDFDANFDQLMNKAQFLANNGRPGEASVVASMAGRYKDFHRGQAPAAVPVSQAAASQFPYLTSLDQSRFQGHEATLIGNAISRLDNVVDGAKFYIDIAMDRLSYLQEQPVIGQYLATAEFILTFHYRLANNPEFALSIADGVGGVVIDAATGFAQFAAHPIDSSMAVVSAVIEYEKTWHAMKGFAVKAYDDLSTCNQETEECGQIIGRIGGEIAFGTLTAGVGSAIKNTAIAVKVANKINSTVGKVAGKFARRGKALDLDADDLDTVFQTGYSLTPCEMPLACAPDSVANADTLLKYADDMGLKGADAVDGVKEFGEAAKKIGATSSETIGNFGKTLNKFGEKLPEWPKGISFPVSPLNLKKHMATNIDGFTQKAGIKGTHNLVEFNKAAERYKIKITKSNDHPSVSGVKEIEYRILKADGSGQYKATPFKKTVYDPAKISDDEMLYLGQVASAKKFPGKGVTEPYNASAGGISFRVYIDGKGGIKNVHPRFGND